MPGSNGEIMGMFCDCTELLGLFWTLSIILICGRQKTTENPPTPADILISILTTHHMSKGELFIVFMIELPLHDKSGKTCGWR
jgi:hypothetical protein